MADGDLLTPVVPDDEQHQSFKSLILEPRHAPARDLLRELVLFSVGHFGSYTVTRPVEAPDFRFERNGFGVWVESVAANPSAKKPEQMAAEGGD